MAALIVLAVLVMGMWPQPAHALNGQCKWEGGAGAPTYPSCKLEDCIGNGGLAQCTEPEIRPSSGLSDAQVDGDKWDYLFDSGNEYDLGPFCAGEGGTFMGFYAQPACPGMAAGYNSILNASTESLALAAADAGMHAKFSNPDNPVSRTSDTGWGATGSYNLWPGPPMYRNGILYWDHRRMGYTGPYTTSPYPVELLRTRQLLCPQGYDSRTLVNGDLGCFIPAETCCTIGDPVSPVTGAETEKVLDYRASEPGDLELGHYYNSQARYRLPGGGPFKSGFGDYWHFSYDRHLTTVSGTPDLTAVVQREDGSLEEFDGSGNEVLNRTGAADRLVNAGTLGWTLTLANGDVEIYDATGKLTSITERSGIKIALSYGTNGKISQATDSFGHALTFAYNAANQLISVTLPDGSSTISYAYGNQGQLASVTYANQTVMSYAYEDPNNSWLLTGIADESGQRYATFVYNAQGVVTHEEHAGGVGAYDFSVGGISYQTEINASFTDPLRQTRNYVLDNSNGVFKLRYSTPYCPDCPNVSQSSYDANGNPQAETDLNGNQTTHVYDVTRNLETSRTEALSGGQVTAATRTTTTQWHPTLSLPTQSSVYGGASATGAPLRTTSYSYDGYGNLLTTTVTDGATGAARSWTYTYYNSGLYGQLQTMTGPRTDVSDVTTYTYYNCNSGRECGHVHTITDSLGHTTTYNAYDANGLPLTITDPNGLVTVLTYDLRQRLTTRTVGTEQTRFDYYPTGLLQRTTLPDASYTTNLYDPAHRLVEVDDSLGNRLVYSLDAAGNRLQEQRYDPSGALATADAHLYNALGELWQELTSSRTDAQATVYGYDSDGNRATINAPLGRNTTYSYDALNRLTQTTDPAGGLTSLAYDAIDGLTSVTDPRQLITRYTRNGLGNLTKLQSPDKGTSSYTFDGAGNLRTSTDARGAAAIYSYDSLNRVTQIGYPDQTLTFNYDQGVNAIGRLSGVTDGSGQTAFGYDALGRINQKRQVIGGVSLTVNYGYQRGQLISLTTPSGQALTYTYNGNNQVSSVSVNGAALVSSVLYSPFGATTGWNWGNGTQTVRKYDVDGRLVEIDSAGTSTYTFYDDGNIGTRSDDTANHYSVAAGTTTLAVAAGSNQLTSASGALTRTYSYDNAGNTTGTGASSFVYNAAGRLISVAQGSVTTTFSVNALGQRVSKASPAGTTLFAYDEAGHLLGEYSSSGALLQETVWLGEIPIATLRPNGSGSVDIYYIHTDHLDSPRHITRASDNVVVWRWSSDPFGVGFVDQDPDGDGQLFIYNLRFPGQYHDDETGLDYNYFRDYDPATGRYVETDPTGLRGGINVYAYVGGNPLAGSDRFGLFDSTGFPVADVAKCITRIGPLIGAIGFGVVALATPLPTNACDTVYKPKSCTDCRKITEDIYGAMNVLQKRLDDLLNDVCNLYDLAYSVVNPSLPKGCNETTWVGHIEQATGWQNRLFKLIAKAEQMGCPIPAGAWALATRPLPRMPRGR